MRCRSAAAVVCGFVQAGLAQPVPVVYSGQGALIGGPGATWAGPLTLSAANQKGYTVIAARGTGGTLIAGVNDLCLLRTGPFETGAPMALAVLGQDTPASMGLSAGTKWQLTAANHATAVNDDGAVATIRSLSGPGVTTANNTVAAQFAGGIATTLLRKGAPAPGLPGETISFLSSVYPGHRSEGGAGGPQWVVAGATTTGPVTSSAVWRISPGGAVQVYRAGQSIPTSTGSVTASGIDGTWTDGEGAIGMGLVAGGRYNVAVEDGNGARLWIRPDTTPVPSLGAAARIANWSAGDLIICRGAAGPEVVSLCALSVGGASAIVRVTAPDGPAEILARPPIPVPYLGGNAQITTIYSPIAYDPDGGIVFEGEVSSSPVTSSAAWYIPPPWMNQGSSPRLLLRQGQSVAVNGTTRTVGTATSFANGVGRDGRVVMKAQLSASPTSHQCLFGGVPTSNGVGMAPLLCQNAPLTLPGGGGVTLGPSAAASDSLNDRGRMWVMNTPTGSGVGLVLRAGGSCGLADVGRAGGAAGPDGQLDNNDFVVFINLFFGSQGRADLGRTGGLGGRDGTFDNNDFIVFIDEFFAGCL